MARLRSVLFVVSVLTLLAGACTPPPATPAAANKPAAAPYFAGKTITLLVAGNPGGGVDLNARLTAEFLEKHLPGNPKFTLTAMIGGAGIQVANTLTDRGATRPDGFTIGAPGRTAPTYQAAGQPGIAYDAAKLEYIGGLGDDDGLIYVKTSTGITSVDDIKKSSRRIVFAAGPKANYGYVVPDLLRSDAGWNINVIGGLGTSPEVLLAVERGDAEGAWENYQSLMSAKKEWVDNGTIKIIARHGTNQRTLDGLPQVLDLLPPEAGQILTMLSPGWGVPLVAPPGTPAEIMKLYRDAMAAMVVDPAFIAEAQKRGVTTKLVTGEECLQIAQRMLAAQPSVIERYKQIVES